MLTKTNLLAVVAVLTFASLATAGDPKVTTFKHHAGTTGHLVRPHVGHRVPVVGTNPFFHNSGFNKAAVIQAQGDFLRNRGEADVNHSIAEHNRELTKAEKLENARRKLDFIADRNEFQRQYREQRIAEARAKNEYAIAAQEIRRVRSAPQPVLDTPLPIALQTSEVQALVIKARTLLLTPTDGTLDQATHFSAIRDILDQVEFELKALVRQISAPEYLQAKRFLRELDRQLATAANEAGVKLIN
ncbi:hypothetical protein [Calycomorphotria hydatis]|nr:hypothetical protein [Calycomorphotria hydatis]